MRARLDLGTKPFQGMAIYLGLALVVLVIYGQVYQFGFVNWDDPLYIQDPNIRAGLSLRGLLWAFSSTTTFNWTPLTLLSHMLDCTLFGANPGPPHLVNLALHLANTWLCFRVLEKLTGARTECAFVSILFALHPLHAESVAWISERKDVLSTLFLFLAINSYINHAREPKAVRYLLLVLWFLLGLMAKAMLVTLPFLLLLLDFWPLGRIGSGTRRWTACLREKVPLVLLAGVFGVLALVAQGSALASLHEIPLKTRLLNSMLSYSVYLVQFFAPFQLGPFYPMPSGWRLVLGGTASALAMLSLGALAYRCRHRAPFLLTGFLWYLISLLPVIGILQVGEQAHADRYTYVPFVGLAIALAWGVARLARISRPAAWTAPVLASAWAAALGILAWRQVGIWQDSLHLWQHAVEITTSRAFTPAYNLGWTYVERGRFQDGLRQYLQVAKTWPGEIKGFIGIGEALQGLGRTEEALAVYQRALRLDPRNPQGLFKGAMACFSLGRGPEAEAFARAFFAVESGIRSRFTREDVLAASILRAELGKACLREGRAEQARAYFSEACRQDPSNPVNPIGFAAALVLLGKRDEGIAVLESYLETYGRHPDVERLLARLKGTGGPVGAIAAQAVRYARTEASHVRP